MGARSETFSSAKKPKSLMSPVLQMALLIGVTLHLVGFLLFRVESNPLPNAPVDQPFVEFVGADAIDPDSEFGEQAELRDSAPLFIPTRWNAAQSMRTFSVTVAGDKFPEFEPEIEVAKELQPANLPIAPALAVESPSDLLASRFWRFFQEFGESGAAAPRLDNPGPVAEVVSVGGTPDLGRSSTAGRPLQFPAEVASDLTAVGPAVYFVRISSSSGRLGAPTLAQSSGSQDFDRAVRAWLDRSEVRARLPDGYLEVRVFP